MDERKPTNYINAAKSNILIFSSSLKQTYNIDTVMSDDHLIERQEKR